MYQGRPDGSPRVLPTPQPAPGAYPRPAAQLTPGVQAGPVAWPPVPPKPAGAGQRPVGWVIATAAVWTVLAATFVTYRLHADFAEADYRFRERLFGWLMILTPLACLMAMVTAIIWAVSRRSWLAVVVAVLAGIGLAASLLEIGGLVLFIYLYAMAARR